MKHSEPVDMTVVSSYGHAGASTRVRIHDWLDHFETTARQFDYIGSADNQARTLLRHPSATLRAELSRRDMARTVRGTTLLLSRRASPFSRGGLEARLLESAARGIYDFDDALYADVGHGVGRFWPDSAVWRASVLKADLVIAGSDVLAEEAQRLTRNVVMIPSCIAPEGYVRKRDYEISGTPTAVWLGSPATEGFLTRIAPALQVLNRSHGLRLRLISRGVAPIPGLDHMVDRVEWSPHTVGDELSRSDLGIMPLSDTPSARGKCAYKLLQYSATGLPSVASPVGANRDALRVVNGWPAQTTDEWVGAIEEVISLSAAKRSARGGLAREGASASYSFRAWEDTWARAVGLEVTV